LWSIRSLGSGAAGGSVITNTASRLRILIADDHPLMRDGLRAACEREPDMVVVGEAADGAETIAMYARLRPDAVLMDLQMPNVDGLQAIAAIRALVPDAFVVVLTTYPGDARVARAISLGAKSYILKTSSRAEITAALRVARGGRSTIPAEIAADLDAHRGMDSLSDRELTVLRMIAAGKQNRHIGEALHVSEETVKSRVKHILAKLQASDRTHAVTIAIRRGFLDR
jgi:DNA-binding NarL/FixJ family response regulator